jgi:hypothetical protein
LNQQVPASISAATEEFPALPPGHLPKSGTCGF